MGLDATPYARIEALPVDWVPTMDEDDLYDDGIVRAGTYHNFPRAMDGLPGGHEPDPRLPDHFIGSRWYQISDPGPRTRASYGGHSYYRNRLKEAFWTDEQRATDDWEQPPGTPFIDLIWFADNEGTLGPEACARLAEDFEAYPELSSEGEGDYYPELHRSWAAAVRHAADGGCIRFS